MMKKGNNMLKFEETAQVGDLIKAYDFEPIPGRGECYIVGRVLSKGFMDEVGCKAYQIKVVHRVFSGKADPIEDVEAEDLSYVPFQVCMTEFENRVTKI